MVEYDGLLLAVGQRITEHRLAVGWTQHDLADATRINRVTISRLERGRQNFGISQLVTIATALECTPNDLVWLA